MKKISALFHTKVKLFENIFCKELTTTDTYGFSGFQSDLKIL